MSGKSDFSKVSDDTKNTATLDNRTDVKNKMSNNYFEKVNSVVSDSESLFDENIHLKRLNKLYSHCATSTPKNQNKSSAQSVELKRVNEIFIAFNHFKCLNPPITEDDIFNSNQKNQPSIEDKKQFLYNKLDNALKSEESEDRQRSLLNKLLTVIDDYEKEKEYRDSGNMTASIDLNVGNTPKQYESTEDQAASVSGNSSQKRRRKKKSKLLTFDLKFKNNIKKKKGSSDNKENESNTTMDQTQKRVSNDASTSFNMNKRASGRVQKKIPQLGSDPQVSKENSNKSECLPVLDKVLHENMDSGNMTASIDLNVGNTPKQYESTKDQAASVSINSRKNRRCKKKSELLTFDLQFKNNIRKKKGSSDNKENESKTTMDQTQKRVSNDASTSFNMNKRASDRLQKKISKSVSDQQVTKENSNKRECLPVLDRVLKEVNKNDRNSYPTYSGRSKDVHSENTNRRRSLRIQNKGPQVRLNKYDLYLQQFLRDDVSKKASPKTKTPKSKRKQSSNSFDKINLTDTSKKRRLYCSETWLSSLHNCS